MSNPLCGPCDDPFIKTFYTESSACICGPNCEVAEKREDRVYFRMSTEIEAAGVEVFCDGFELFVTKANQYKFKFEVLPLKGCPMVVLPLHLEIDIGNNTPEQVGVYETTVENGNSVTSEGVFAPGTTLRIWTELRYLKFFEELQVCVDIGVSSAADILEFYTNVDREVKLRYIPERPITRPDGIPLFPPQDPVIPPVGGGNAGARIQWQWDVLPHYLQQYADAVASADNAPATPRSTEAPAGPYNTGAAPYPYVRPYPPTEEFANYQPPNPNQVIFRYESVYNKFLSVPDSINFYLGFDSATLPACTDYLSIFIQNLENRGYAPQEQGDSIVNVNNHKKYNYMIALSYDKLAFYEAKTNTFLQQVYSEVVDSGKPLLSSFQDQLVNYFLDMHIGPDPEGYPKYVVDYFGNFAKIIGSGNPNAPKRPESMIYGNSIVPQVRAYFARRTEAIKQIPLEIAQQCIVFWWIQAGISPNSLVTEAIHNIIAFTQFTNVMFIMADLEANINTPPPLGRPLPVGVPPATPRLAVFGIPRAPADSLLPVTNPAALLSVPKTTYFSELTRILTPPPLPTPPLTSDEIEQRKLNLAREVYRIGAPNQVSFSLVGEKNFAAPSKMTRARHFHQLLMIQQEGGFLYPDGAQSFGGYYVMDTRLNTLDAPVPNARYKDFQTGLNLIDIASDGANVTVADPVNNFTVSLSDQESLLDKTYTTAPVDSTKVIPVFIPPAVVSPLNTNAPTSQLPAPNGPGTPYYSYWPFGKGYRRCAGEVYVYFVTILMLEKFRLVTFKYGEAPACRPTVTLGPFNEQPNNIYAVAPTATFYQ